MTRGAAWAAAVLCGAACSVVGTDVDGFFECSGGSCGGSGGSGGSGASADSGANPDGEAGTAAGGSDADGGGGSPPDAGCGSRRPPEPPKVADGDDGKSYYFAMREILLDQSPSAWASIGFDLDGVCTTEASPTVECDPPTGDFEIDGDQGIDNVFGHQIFPLLKTLRSDLQQVTREVMSNGDTIVVHISGYNGEPDDPSVRGWLAHSVHAVPDGETMPGTPKWDGTDSVYVEDGAFMDGDVTKPLLANDAAYVTDGRLVLRLPNRVPFPISTSDGTMFVVLSDTYLTADIAPDLSKLDNVTLAGRWASVDVLTAVRSFGICDGIQYELVENLLMDKVDIRAIPGTGGPDAVCDALSVAFSMRADPVLLGGLVPTVPPVDQCGG